MNASKSPGLTPGADSAPPVPADPLNPATVSADGVPRAQIDGVVRQQLIVGNTAYDEVGIAG